MVTAKYARGERWRAREGGHSRRQHRGREREKKERMKESVQGLKKEIVPVAPVPVA